jgi:hypothetical protein
VLIENINSKPVFNFFLKAKTIYSFLINTFPACLVTHNNATFNSNGAFYSSCYNKTPLTSTFFKEVYHKVVFTSNLTQFGTNFIEFKANAFRKISLV